MNFDDVSEEQLKLAFFKLKIHEKALETLEDVLDVAADLFDNHLELDESKGILKVTDNQIGEGFLQKIRLLAVTIQEVITADQQVDEQLDGAISAEGMGPPFDDGGTMH
jgi:hypothetical protein|tara:strand:+ start:806 stop:1132 length:327 start_codon:yes stop_codon:yes gene_type:complete